MCNTCGCKSAENFEAKPYGDFHKRDFYTVAHGKTEEPRFAEVYETFETWDEAYKEANRLSRFTDGEYVFVFSPKDASPYVIEPQNKDYFGAYDDSISERQEWLIGELGGKVDKSMNRSKASDYIKELQGKESGTWKDAETFEAEDDYFLLEDYEGEGEIICSNDKEKVRTFLRNNFMELCLSGYYRPHELYGMGLDLEILENEGVEHPTIQDQLLNWFDSQTFAKQISWGGFRDESKVLKSGGFYTKGDAYIEPLMGITHRFTAERESKRKGSHAPKMQLINYEDVMREKMKNQNMKDAETVDFSEDRGLKRDVLSAMDALAILRNRLMTLEGKDIDEIRRNEWKDDTYEGMIKVGFTYAPLNMTPENIHVIITSLQEQYLGYSAENFEANEEAVEQTDANMVNEGSVEAFYGGGAKVSVSSAGIQPTANPSVDEAFNVGNQVGLDVAEQEIMNENPSVEVNYGAENDDDDDDLTDCQVCGEMFADEALNQHPTTRYTACYECFENELGEDDEGWVDVEDYKWDKDDYDSENMSLKESAKLGFGVGAGLLGFNVALLGIATIGGFLLNRD